MEQVQFVSGAFPVDLKNLFFRNTIITCKFSFYRLLIMRATNLPVIGLFLAFVVSGIYLLKPGSHSATPNNSPIPVTEKIRKDTVQRRHAFYYDSAPELKTKAISPGALSARDLMLDTPFDAAVAFSKLLPGNYYHLPEDGTVSDSVDMIEWSCPACTVSTMKGWDESVPFPLNDNETTLQQVLSFKDKAGKQNYMLMFGTTEKVFPDPTCGRFSCGYLGLAWFREEAGRFQLQAWSPCLGCFGAFQNVPGIRLLELGTENFGCYIINSNGCASGPYNGDLFVFGARRGVFTTILHITDAERACTISGWGSSIKANNVRKPLFNDLLYEVVGSFNKYNNDYEEDSGRSLRNEMPAELRPYFKTKDSFEFNIERRYSYVGGKYKSVQSKTKITEGVTTRRKPYPVSYVRKNSRK